MKTTTIFMLFLSMTFFTACSIFKKSSSSQTNQESMGNNSITEVKWKLIELDGKPVADKINGKEPFIKLSDDRYSGTGGCNGLGGTFTLKDNGRIAFTQGMSTMMACEIMEIEHGLNKALVAADNYTINDDTLSLNKARMAPLARFVEVTDAHALNGTWEVDDISESKKALDELYPNGAPTLVFDLPATKASGFGSCNNYSLTFTLEGENIKFGAPMSTEMACEGNGEVAFFKTLKTVTQYSVHGETLNLILGDVAVMRLAKK